MISIWLRIFCLLLLTGASTTNASEIVIGGSGTDIATMRIMAKSFSQRHPDVKVKVLPSLGSGGGIKALTKGHLHIGLSSRALKKHELEYPVHAYRYARTPLVLATQSSNSTHTISSQVYFDAMMGNRQYWPDGRLIRLVLRPFNDSDTLLLISHYPQAEKALKKAYQQRGIPIATTDQKAANSLESISGSLGTTTLAVIMSEKRKLKALTVDGIAPTPQNLANERYDMSKDLFLVLPNRPTADSLAFVNYVRSKHGSRILTETGHLPTPFKLEE